MPVKGWWIFVRTRNLCHNKTFVTTKPLSGQPLSGQEFIIILQAVYHCQDKGFLSRQRSLVLTKVSCHNKGLWWRLILSWHTACKRMMNLCQDKEPLSQQKRFVMTKMSLVRTKMSLVMTKISCHDKGFLSRQRFLVPTKVSCPDKGFLSRQRFLVLTKVSCHDKGFLSRQRFLVTTKVNCIDKDLWWNYTQPEKGWCTLSWQRLLVGLLTWQK